MVGPSRGDRRRAGGRDAPGGFRGAAGGAATALRSPAAAEGRDATAPEAAGPPRIRVGLLRAFAWWTARDLRRSFDALRVLRPGPELEDGASGLVLYLNHASWWDPLLALALARRLLPSRAHRGPIDADALQRYPILAKIGLFGIARGTAGGARRFLEVGEAVARDPAAALWVTPQGAFADPRARPPELAPGLGHLAARLRRHGVGARLVPVALEYPFWQERRPEALAAFGEPVAAGDGAPAAEWTRALGASLARVQDRLAAAAQRQDAAAFETLALGRAGIHPVYDLMRRLGARLRGVRYRARHADEGSA